MEEAKDAQPPKMRLYLTIASYLDRPSEVVFMRAESMESAADKRQHIKCEHVGPIAEVPEGYENVVESVLMLALSDWSGGHNMAAMQRGHDGGRPLFCVVYETSHSGFTAQTLLGHPDGWLNDMVSMAGSVDSDFGTPGEALIALAGGLDRHLASNGWRSLMGAPPPHVPRPRLRDRGKAKAKEEDDAG